MWVGITVQSFVDAVLFKAISINAYLPVPKRSMTIINICHETLLHMLSCQAQKGLEKAKKRLCTCRLYTNDYFKFSSCVLGDLFMQLMHQWLNEN